MPNPSNKNRSDTRWPSTRIILLSAVGITVGFAAYRGGSVSAKGTPIAKELRVEFPAPGTTLVTVDGRPDKANYLLAASDLWANTGLVVPPQKTVLVTASGRANLAVHRLIDSAVDDTKPHLGWVGPNGGSAGETRVKDTYRLGLKIHPEAEDGMLLAYLHKNGDPDPGKLNPHPGKLVVVGARGEVTNESSEPRTLWLVVNDAVLADDAPSKRAYLEVEKDDDKKIFVRPLDTFGRRYEKQDFENPKTWTPLEHWQYVQRRQYWNLWFDDNVGFYQIQVDFNPSLESRPVASARASVAAK